MRLNKTLFNLLAVLLIVYAGQPAFAQKTLDNPTAQQIVDRSIERWGGKELLNKTSSIEMIHKIVMPNGDTTSVAIKKAGFDKYYVSQLSQGYENTTKIYNQGDAVLIKNGNAEKITDPVSLENLKLQCYLCPDQGYEALGYKLTRVEDQKFKNFDCYVVVAVSPLGREYMNFYDKKLGDLIMILYPTDDKAIFADHYTKNGLTLPSLFFLTDHKAIMRDILQSVNIRDIDDNWFRIPQEGKFEIPAIFREGTFKYTAGYPGASVTRTADYQTENGSQGQNQYRISWDKDDEYTLYSLKPGNATLFIKTRITNWIGNKFYCHYTVSNGTSSTCAFEKVK